MRARRSCPMGIGLIGHAIRDQFCRAVQQRAIPVSSHPRGDATGGEDDDEEEEDEKEEG